MNPANRFRQWLRRKVPPGEIPGLRWSNRRREPGDPGCAGAAEPGNWLQRAASKSPDFDYALKRKVLLQLRKKVKKEHCG